jgi:GntR family negative regulator for fad regulon and positive regulator of fabA
LNQLPNWQSPQKPAELTYHRLVQSILDGSLPANNLLPNEHELADALGVTRSTLREALQRLSANGLVEIQHGKPTRVRDIWLEGNMNTLSTIIQTQHASLTARWVPQMLAVRADIAPQYSFLAVKNNPEKVIDLIDEISVSLEDLAPVFAAADWNLHHRLTVLSKNPIYTLILNGFRDYYHLLAEKYFSLEDSRQYSLQFYHQLKILASERKPEETRALVAGVMARSIRLWELSIEKEIRSMPPHKGG